MGRFIDHIDHFPYYYLIFFSYAKQKIYTMFVLWCSKMLAEGILVYIPEFRVFLWFRLE